MLQESVIEQPYLAVRDVLEGAKITGSPPATAWIGILIVVTSGQRGEHALDQALLFITRQAVRIELLGPVTTPREAHGVTAPHGHKRPGLGMMEPEARGWWR